MALDIEEFLDRVALDTTFKKDILEITYEDEHIKSNKQLEEGVQHQQNEGEDNEFNNNLENNLDSESNEELTHLQDIESLRKHQREEDKNILNLMNSKSLAIETSISNEDVKKTHVNLQELSYEISTISNSHLSVKEALILKYSDFMKRHLTQLLNRHLKDSKDTNSLEKISLSTSQQNILQLTKREDIDKLLGLIQDKLSKQELTEDKTVIEQLYQMTLFNEALAKRRIEVENICSVEFKRMFANILHQFAQEIKFRNMFNSVLYLEMAHMLLQKETQYNIHLRLKYFPLIIQAKKKIKLLSSFLEDTLSRQQLSYVTYLAKAQLISLTSHTPIEYSKSDVKEVISEVENSSFTKKEKKEIFSLISNVNIQSKKLQLSQKEVSQERVIPQEEMRNQESTMYIKKEKNTQKVMNNTFQEGLIHTENVEDSKQLSVESNIKHLLSELVNSKTNILKERNKKILFAYIKKYVPKKHQSVVLQKIKEHLSVQEVRK